MTIKKICNTHVITIGKDTTIREAANIMAGQNIGFLVINEVNGDTLPIGTITDRDIVIKAIAKDLNLQNTRVSEIMVKDVVTMDENRGVYEAIKIMSDKKIRRLPIICDNRITGLVTLDDLFLMLAGEINTLADILRRQIS